MVRVAVILATIGVALAVAGAAVLASTMYGSRCTHGVSSIGPVVLDHGRLVRDARPNTQACLP